MMPVAMGGGEGADFRAPLGRAVIGGVDHVDVADAARHSDLLRGAGGEQGARAWLDRVAPRSRGLVARVGDGGW